MIRQHQSLSRLTGPNLVSIWRYRSPRQGIDCYDVLNVPYPVIAHGGFPSSDGNNSSSSNNNDNNPPPPPRPSLPPLSVRSVYFGYL